MPVAPKLLPSAAAAGIASLAAACVIPPAGLGPRPNEVAQGAPEVAFYAFDSGTLNNGSGLLSYSTSRDAYAAVFQVDQRGRVSVLSPSSPSADPVSLGGQGYVVYPSLTSTSLAFLRARRDYDQIPYVFAITSDTPLDLGGFERGKRWARSVGAGDAYEPDSVIARVADQVLPRGADYASDFAYVGPQAAGTNLGVRQFLRDCARPVDDLHDYRYFRELWAVFDPQDTRFGVNPIWLYAPAFGWGGSYAGYGTLSYVQYRAQFATTAFRGACSGLDYNSYATQYAGLGGWYYSP